MQTRYTAQLARKLASAARHMTLRQVATHFQILTADGRTDSGMVKRLIDGYEPRRPETRARLGLPAICPSCNRRIPHEHAKPAPVTTSEPYDPTAPLAEFVSPEEPVRHPLRGAWRSPIDGRWVDFKTFFREAGQVKGKRPRRRQRQ